MNHYERRLLVIFVTLQVMVLAGNAIAATIPFGSTFPIGIGPHLRNHSAIVYSATDNRFLDVWQDARNGGTSGEDIFGQLVNEDGKLVGSNIPISIGRNNPDITPQLHGIASIISTWRRGLTRAMRPQPARTSMDRSSHPTEP